MELATPKKRYTVAEYLEAERTSLEKHEYRDGVIVAMAGGSVDHSLIVANVIRELGNRLKGKPCHVFDSNLRVRLPRTKKYTYPDATVICGPREIDPGDTKGETVTNPRLIVEVLSESTEAYDRGDKFSGYRQIESFQEYVLVTQGEPRIEVFYRQPDGTWLFDFFSGLESAAKIRSVDTLLPLSEVYAGIVFPPTEDGVVVPT